MSQSKINPDLLYEALGREISIIKNTKAEQDEVLRNTKQDFDHLFLKISENVSRLEQLYQKPIAVDIEAIRAEHERIKSTVENVLATPKWLAISFLFLIVGTGISLGFNYKQYVKLHQQTQYIKIANGDNTVLKNENKRLSKMNKSKK